jgi:hypothetical protein
MSSREKESLTERLFALEQLLMDPLLRKDREKVSALLAEDFREFGSSGCVWNREAILDLLVNEVSQPAPIIEDFAVQNIGPEAKLVTYRSVRESAISGVQVHCLRSSIWIRRGEHWQMIFHQGTKVSNT